MDLDTSQALDLPIWKHYNFDAFNFFLLTGILDYQPTNLNFEMFRLLTLPDLLASTLKVCWMKMFALFSNEDSAF